MPRHAPGPICKGVPYNSCNGFLKRFYSAHGKMLSIPVPLSWKKPGQEVVAFASQWPLLIKMFSYCFCFQALDVKHTN